MLEYGVSQSGSLEVQIGLAPGDVLVLHKHLAGMSKTWGQAVFIAHGNRVLDVVIQSVFDGDKVIKGVMEYYGLEEIPAHMTEAFTDMFSELSSLRVFQRIQSDVCIRMGDQLYSEACAIRNRVLARMISQEDFGAKLGKDKSSDSGPVRYAVPECGRTQEPGFLFYGPQGSGGQRRDIAVLVSLCNQIGGPNEPSRTFEPGLVQADHAMAVYVSYAVRRSDGRYTIRGFYLMNAMDVGFLNRVFEHLVNRSQEDIDYSFRVIHALQTPSMVGVKALLSE